MTYILPLKSVRWGTLGQFTCIFYVTCGIYILVGTNGEMTLMAYFIVYKFEKQMSLALWGKGTKLFPKGIWNCLFLEGPKALKGMSCFKSTKEINEAKIKRIKIHDFLIS